ncbi:MAG: YigZ family protein [Clostridiales bacterium]|nr:YigZ family protein [Clostridiales bacterium]
MNNEYKTVLGEAEILYEEKKSKFISRVVPVSKEREAIDFIDSIKERYRDATHNVYAYSVYEDVLLQRFSDDGEPSGTSGKPTLESIVRLGVVNVAVVTTRYFGGTLLGAAGLIRAYGKSAQLAIEKAKVIKMVYRINIKLIFEYNYIGKLQNLVQKIGYRIDKLVYDIDVEMVVQVPKEEKLNFITKVVDETNNRILWEELDGVYVASDD